jgi:hypothetical protein
MLMLVCSPVWAVTEYKVSVKPSGQGGDYITLATAVTTNATNLTTSNVINGSLTRGAVAGAITQTGTGATAVMISKTATQMLVGVITGTANASGTWYPTADGNDTVNCWTPTTAGDSVQFSVEIKGTWDSADTSAVSVSGYTTGASNSINIYTSGDARHAGIWSTTAYRLERTLSSGQDSAYCIAISSENNFTTIDGLQVKLITGGGNSDSVGGISAATTTGVTIKNNIITLNASSLTNTTGINGLYSNNARRGTVYTNYIYNNFVYGFVKSALPMYGIRVSMSGQYSNSTMTTYVYNNSSYNNYSGIAFSNGSGTTYASRNTFYLSNNISTSSSSADYTFATGMTAGSNDYNLSSDTTATGAHSLVSKAATDQFFDITTGAEDLHLKVGADAIDAGTDLGSPYDVGIDGNTRTAPWDIGADEYVAAGNAVSPSWRIQGMKLQGVRFK